MPHSCPRSAGVTAAATYAFLCCAAVFLFWGYLFLAMMNAPADEHGKYLYETQTLDFLLLALVPPVLVALGIRTAIGLFQLRPWARVAALIWASLSLTLCLALIGFRPFETFVIPHRFVHEVVLFRQLISISFLLMLLPASIWWLFYFRAKSVKSQFLPVESQSLPSGLPTAEKI